MAGRAAMPALAATAVLLVGGTAAWWTFVPDDGDAPAASLPVPAGATARPGPEVLIAEAPPAAAPASESAVPEGMTAEQWRTLQDALKDAPNRAAEIGRVTDYMAFLSRAARFRGLRERGAADQPEARQLARSLLDALPRHVAQGETSAAEAQLMVQAYVDALYPNDDERQAQRDLQMQRVTAVLPVSASSGAAAAADARYQQGQAEVVAQWYAQPPAQRSEGELEASLDALRRKVYAAPAPAPFPTSTQRGKSP